MNFLSKNILLRACLLLAAWGLAAPAVAVEPAKAGVPAADRALKSGFMPHKALYDIKLAATRSGTQILNITGQMLYEWQPACGGWISNHRFNLYYEYADSPAMQVLSDFSTFESFDGKSFNFTSQKRRDGQLFEELRGQATLDDKGKGEAVFSLPKGLAFDLPPGTLLPMAHTLAVFDQLKQDKKFFKATIFDGSDEEGPVEVNAFIGKSAAPPAPMKKNARVDARLLESPGHKMRLAFFPLNDPSSAADYEMNLVMHDNGVISDMFIEYDDFSVTQKLVALESLKGGCDPVKPIAQ